MTELTISTADIAASIQKNLEGFEPGLEQSQVGRVLEVGDGIARVSGLPDAAVNELLQFESGTFGLALNLDEDSIGAVVLGEVDDIEEGQTVLILEAMKMQNEVAAPISGTISAVHCEDGMNVEANVPLIVIEPAKPDKD